MTTLLPILSCDMGRCRYGSPCCRWGVDLEPDEVVAIELAHPGTTIPGLPFEESDTGARTRVQGDACVFLRKNACSIHAEPYFPSTCRAFPLKYDGDTSSCPDAP